MKVWVVTFNQESIAGDTYSGVDKVFASEASAKAYIAAQTPESDQFFDVYDHEVEGTGPTHL